MSISISYSTTYSGWTVADYLADWSAYFGDVNHRPGQVVDGSNTGGFNPGPFDGSQYALKSTASDAAFIAGGDLHYTLFSNPSHTLWGKLDSIALGDTLTGGASSGGYALDSQEEASNAAMETDDSGVLLQNVKDTEGAIGYVALSYLTGDAGVSTLAIDGVEPTLENTYSGDYPVWTYEHMYTKGEPDEVTKTFIDYIMSDEYGEQMETLGYGVSSKMTVTEH